MKRERSINWLDNTSRSLKAMVHDTAFCSEELTELMAKLLLEELPLELHQSMIDLLPEDSRAAFQKFEKHSEAIRDKGYEKFVRKASALIYKRCEHAQLDKRLSQRIIENFLWLVTEEIPPDLKTQMAEFLPPRLRNRMNLRTGTTEEDKVA